MEIGSRLDVDTASYVKLLMKWFNFLEKFMKFGIEILHPTLLPLYRPFQPIV